MDKHKSVEYKNCKKYYIQFSHSPTFTNDMQTDFAVNA